MLPVLRSLGWALCLLGAPPSAETPGSYLLYTETRCPDGTIRKHLDPYIPREDDIVLYDATAGRGSSCTTWWAPNRRTTPASWCCCRTAGPRCWNPDPTTAPASVCWRRSRAYRPFKERSGFAGSNTR